MTAPDIGSGPCIDALTVLDMGSGWVMSELHADADTAHSSASTGRLRLTANRRWNVVWSLMASRAGMAGSLDSYTYAEVDECCHAGGAHAV